MAKLRLLLIPGKSAQFGQFISLCKIILHKCAVEMPLDFLAAEFPYGFSVLLRHLNSQSLGLQLV